MPNELILLLAVMAVIGLCLDAMRHRELALRAAQRVCTGQRIQLLDETVGLASLRLRRHSGLLKLERHYSFEVSVDGKDRHEGRLCLVDGRLANVTAPWLVEVEVLPLVPRSERAEEPRLTLH
jgi:hypothetical protein